MPSQLSLRQAMISREQAMEAAVEQVREALGDLDVRELTEVLDELVHDYKDDEAEAINSSAEDMEAYAGEKVASMSDADAYERVHDLKGEEAAEINNAGMEAQVRYLLEQTGTSPDAVAQLVDTIKDNVAELGV